MKKIRIKVKILVHLILENSMNTIKRLDKVQKIAIKFVNLDHFLEY